eukprot:CAMPEP_0116841880 /NCGR_PEP_ID=MMETSP0418-20121206/11198_1 /TAXON_ID=1158023 /ORGANISM="Astrosyne radiata, Strain 13vi08-1A" /LENGTH=529 /DNA_ID=CAMNT_0004472411 /DNA_START=400 /DNA_END=1989 /DNA_ORIENTATION=-
MSAETLRRLVRINPQALALPWSEDGLCPLDWALVNPNFTPQHIQALLDFYPRRKLKLRRASFEDGNNDDKYDMTNFTFQKESTIQVKETTERQGAGSGVGAEVASMLVSCDNIQSLDCTDCDFTKDGIHAILTSLACEEQDTALEKLSLRLRVEDLMDECPTPSTFRRIVDTLYQSSSSAIARALQDMLVKNKSLKTLRIKIGSSGDRFYTKTTSQRDLSAVHELGQALSRGLKRNTVLEKLELDSFAISLLPKDILDILGSSGHLSALSFSNMQGIGKSLVDGLQQRAKNNNKSIFNQKLLSLSVANCGLTSRTIEKLISLSCCGDLEELCLSEDYTTLESTVSLNGIVGIQQLPNLKKLMLCCGHMKESLLDTCVIPLLQNNDKLRELQVCGLDWDKGMLDKLSKTLRNVDLEVLDLGRINPSLDMQPLVDVLRDHCWSLGHVHFVSLMQQKASSDIQRRRRQQEQEILLQCQWNRTGRNELRRRDPNDIPKSWIVDRIMRQDPMCEETPGVMYLLLRNTPHVWAMP